MPAPEAFTIANEGSDWAPHESPVRAGAADRTTDSVLSYWRRRAAHRLAGTTRHWPLLQPRLCAPATTVVGWTLADARDPRSSGLWCAPCFLSLLELAGAVGIPIEMPSLDDAARVA